MHARLVQPRGYEFDATDPLLSLVASGLGWAVTTPPCIWQSRQYIDRIDVLPLPATRLSQRTPWCTRTASGCDVLKHELLPQIMAAIPQLPGTAIAFD